MSLYCIIPAYNEEKRIGPVIEKTRKHCGNIIVVDDGSKDGTYEAANGCTVLRHIVNLGKGAALKTGCEYATMNGATQIIVLDSDGQHDPDEIPNFIKALKENEIVFGFRPKNKNMPAVFKFGNWFIDTSIKTLFKISIKDSQCGYRAFTAEAYKKIKWKSTDYSVESEMIAHTGKHRLKYAQTPIKTIYHDKYKGTTVADGISIVLKMIWWKVTR